MKHVATLFALSCCFQLAAGTVSQTAAERFALNLYTERYRAQFHQPPADLSIAAARTVFYQNEPLLYFFNVGHQNGFVITTAQDNLYPLIGYDFFGAYDPDFRQDDFSEWIDNRIAEAKYVVDHQLPPGDAIRSAWSKYDAAARVAAPTSVATIGPLTTTTWNQDCYYNDLCPTGTSSCGHQYTGCGATAMAQMMRYHSFPVQGIGSHSYTWNSITHTVNFGATTYNWSNMPNSISVTNTDVSQLMYHCGVALDMQYGNSGSYCFFNFNSTLPQYFGYANTIQNWFKLFVTNDTVYENRLVAELDSLRPTFYKGSGSSGQHFFICDGYQNSSFPFSFHFNWGWGGLYNGYFYCSSLNPGSYTFTSSQGAAIRVMPPSPSTGISETSITTSYAFPNPATDVVHFQFSHTGTHTITFYDLAGKEIRSLQTENTTQDISVADLPKGIYLAALREGESVSYLKLIRE